jgi:hypothetical protein
VLTRSFVGLIAVAIGIGLLPSVGKASPPRESFHGDTLPPTILAQAVPGFISPPTLNVLPVPDAEIPVGNVEGMPTIAIPRDATQGRGVASPGLNRAATLGLNYRVLVNAPDEQSQQSVRSLVPDAFRTWINGQPVMQVGAYAGLANAQEVVELLGRYGIQAIVQAIE